MGLVLRTDGMGSPGLIFVMLVLAGLTLVAIFTLFRMLTNHKMTKFVIVQT